MPSRRYREHTLSDAAAAAGSAFGLVGEDSAAKAQITATDFRALGAIAIGLCILATVLLYVLK